MNENISFGKIAVLVVVIVGIAGVAFVVGKKSEVVVVALIVTPTSTQTKPVEQKKVIDEAVRMETNFFESKKYGYSVQYAKKYEGQTGYDDITRKSSDERFFLL